MVAGLDTLVDLQRAVIQQVDLPLAARHNIGIDVLRIDKIHAIISGNKWFKLKYALLEALQQKKECVVTFGGAYSNHLVATAYACAALRLRSVGIVRGEPAEATSHSLVECLKLGMELKYVSRETFSDKQQLYSQVTVQYPGVYLIEEGGCNPKGIEGVSEIMDLIPGNTYSHICCAIGTGTMMAGLLNAAATEQFVVGISVLKIPNSNNHVTGLLEHATGNKRNFSIHYDYHFGGYARKTPQLFMFMNDFYRETGIPLDFVYTAKLMYGVTDLIDKVHFPNGSRLLIIHSGGLQGNLSLPKNTLVY